MTDDAAREILIRGARVLAHTEGAGPSLEVLLGVVSERFEAGSAAIVVVEPATGALKIVASLGLEGAALEGLAAAIRSPQHPIARTVADPVTVIDVRPMAPGGPALRSHVPITATRAGTTTVLGVMALAHEERLGTDAIPILEAVADLAALAIERG
jgi:hypothetical protein